MTKPRIRPRGQLLAAMLLPAALGGCQYDLDVTVTQERGQVVFSVPVESVCVDDVRVAPSDRPADLTWYITSDSQRCITRFVYGIVPAGFRQIVAPRPLAPGKGYQVSIDRPSGTGIAYFSPGREGPIEREPPTR